MYLTCSYFFFFFFFQAEDGIRDLTVTGVQTCALPISSQGAVAQLVRVPVCHTGGRGFEPRQPRLDPRRGMTHRAPSATAGGAFAFSGSVVTSTYHKSDRKSTRLNSSHSQISYAVFCLKKKK